MFTKKKNGVPYTDAFANAFKSVQAWRTLALLQMGILIFMTFSLIWLANQRTVLLIPQNLSAAKGEIKMTLGEPFSPDYLTSVAKGDAFNLLNWTPVNIDTQYGAFLNRLTPALYSKQRESLLMEMQQHQEEGLTQSFYITRSLVDGPSVTLHGVLVRATGGREVFRGPAAYTFNYVNVGNGMVMVNGVSQPSRQEQGKK